jgi:hypothetical protein
MPDTHIDSDSVMSVTRRVGKIAEAMPDALSGVVDEVDGLMGGHGWSGVAGELRRGIAEFAETYTVLAGQVAGFAEDLRACVASWDGTEGAHVELFARFGEEG